MKVLSVLVGAAIAAGAITMAIHAEAGLPLVTVSVTAACGFALALVGVALPSRRSSAPDT